MNSKDNYIKTDISHIYLSSPLNNNNFSLIINLFEKKLNNNINIDKDKKNILKFDNNIPSENNINYYKSNNEDIKKEEYDESKKYRTKTVELSANGSIKIKNNNIKNENINFKLEDNNNILDFDDKAENIFMNNNQYSNNSSNNKYKNNNNIFKNENNSDFILQDNPLNINEEDYSNKWKKLSFLYKEKNNNLIKKNIFNILEGLITSKKNNEKIHKIEIIEINYNSNNSKDNPKIKKGKSRNEISNDNDNNDNLNIHNSYNNKTANIKESTDTRISYDNLTNIITTTQINNLSNSSDFKNTINNINININNAKLIIPQISKYNDENENKNYQKTDISKILQKNNILDTEKFKNVIDFLQYKDNLFIKKINNTDPSKVRISLESDKKKKEYGNIYTINEEENESFDSLSLQKSIRNNSQKVTPNKIDIKKSIFNDIKEIITSQNSINSNNLSNVFNNNDIFPNKKKLIEEINIGEDDDDEKINNNIKNSDLNIDNKDNNENKIMSIDLNMNNNNLNEKNIEEKNIEENMNNKNLNENNIEENNIEDNMNNKNLNENNIEEINIEENNIEENMNSNNLNENIDENNNNDLNEYKDMEISDTENEKKEDKEKNYTTPESKEKSIVKLYESINEEGNKKQGPKEFKTFDNDNLQFSDFNNIINNEENNKEDENEKLLLNDNNKKEEDNNIKKRIIINIDENNENIDTSKKINNNQNIDLKNKKNLINPEKEIFSESDNKNILKDSSIFNQSQNLKTPESSIIDINKENDNKSDNRKKIKIFEIESNSQASINKIMKRRSKDLMNEFLKYKVIDNINYKILFSHGDNIINNNTHSIPLQSYIYILQLCLKKKLTQEKKYEIFIRKLINIAEKNVFINKLGNNISNKYVNDNKVNDEIDNFESKIKNLKKFYIYLITKKSELKSKKEKEKLEEEINIQKKQKDINIFFNNLLLLINNNNIINGKNKYDLYMGKIKNILNKYEKIKKTELSEAKTKYKQNKLSLPENEDLYKKEDKNIINDLKKGRTKKIFVITSILLPLIYIFNYFNAYSKNL